MLAELLELAPALLLELDPALLLELAPSSSPLLELPLLALLPSSPRLSSSSKLLPSAAAQLLKSFFAERR